MSKVHSDNILNIPIASVIPFHNLFQENTDFVHGYEETSHFSKDELEKILILYLG
jgi:hypothetical protein